LLGKVRLDGGAPPLQDDQPASGKHTMITQTKAQVATTSRDICRVLFRHKKKVISCFALSLAVALAIAIFWPRTYQSEAKLFVHIGRETVELDPTATTGQVIPVSMSRETEVNSVLEMLRSRAMVEKLVDDLGPEAILHPKATQTTGGPASRSAFSNLLAIVNVDPVSDREKAIISVEKCLGTAVEKKSDVVTITGKAESPELAQRIVSKFVDIYLGAHAQLYRSPGSQAFFVEQTSLLQKKLDGARSQLRDAKNKLGIVSVESQRQVIQFETIDVENKLAQSRASLAAARERVDALRKNMEGLPERLSSEQTIGYPNVAADNMRRDLYQLEIREADLASRFTDTFPALVAVREQIKAAKKPLTAESQPRTQSTTSINTVHNQLQVNLLAEESSVKALAAETQSLESELAQLRERGRTLNENEALISNLEQQVELCKNNYTTYSEKSEQSRIDTALQNERFTNVNVVQPANFSAKPVSPRKAIVLVLGVLGGLALGVGLAFLAESLDPSLRTPVDIEERLSLPVLLSIPHLSRRQVVMN
jgi:uncharacterized protein involved in exopolysaccharide biosynthesis